MIIMWGVAPRGTLSVNFLNYLVSSKGLGGGGGRGGCIRWGNFCEFGLAWNLGWSFFEKKLN
jgi:hypothetical protein